MNYKYWNKIFFFLVIIKLSAVPVYATDAPAVRFLFSINKYYQDKFNIPMGIFVDKERGEIYVADNGRNEVLVFDIKGTPIFKFGKTQGVSSPIDLVVKDDNIYLTQEGKPYIEIFNYRGEAIGQIKPPQNIPFSPGRLTLDEDGSIYVINKEKVGCLVFDKNNVFVRKIGNELTSLTGIALSKDKVYLITPFDSRAIQIYDKQGNFIAAFEGIQDKGGTLGLPTSAIVDKNGLLWLIDALRGVVIYDKTNQELTRFTEYGGTQKQLFFSVDIDFNEDNMIFILEKGAKRVTVFKEVTTK